ncbi:sulfurtransferase [Meiothermus sp.]|uniref:sulfurtransferase n=1 Tax=Meiothermus sp. TaxID=1955249 RepID=UPI0021DCFACC|nr:rhodanese-like domain-containing protein [Meiothermus sp.]GIW25948.1 MAG: thiosulfate sulfurtransferase [Meiothermus sp.]
MSEGAINLDLSGFRGRLRSEEELRQLEQALADLNGRIGAGPDRSVVVYDTGLNTRLTKTAFMLALGGLEVFLWPQGWESRATSQAPAQPTPAEPWARLRRDILLTADEILAQPGALLLDVREPHEFAAARIPGTKNIPLGAFGPANAAALGLQAGQVVGVHCRSGARSATVFWLLRQQGVLARNYLGSMLEWEAEADLPVERT